MKKFIFLTVLFFAALPLLAAGDPDAILGVWKNGSGKGHIRIFKENGKYYGQIVWLRDSVDENGKPKVDKRNRNPALQNKPLIGLMMLRDFRYDGEDWNNGRIYNPSDGKEYKAYLKLQNPNTLTVRGYVGFSLLGKSDTWTRVS